jgi:hypothetical protein
MLSKRKSTMPVPVPPVCNYWAESPGSWEQCTHNERVQQYCTAWWKMRMAWVRSRCGRMLNTVRACSDYFRIKIKASNPIAQSSCTVCVQSWLHPPAHVLQPIRQTAKAFYRGKCSMQNPYSQFEVAFCNAKYKRERCAQCKKCTWPSAFTGIWRTVTSSYVTAWNSQ